MCVKTAIKASTLCSIPAVLGFGGGMLSVMAPRLFGAVLLVAVIGGGVAAYRGSLKAGRGENAYDVEQVKVVAGAMLALSLLFGLWTGIAFSAGLGLLPAGVLVSLATALLAAFTLTFVRRLLAREVTWAEQWMQRFLPEAAASKDGEVATRH